MKRKFKLLFILCMALSAMSQTVYGQTDKRLKGIDKELNELLETWHAPGFAVAVIDKNEVIYAQGFGYSDYENKVPVTENTLFAIGSCSKSFTSGVLGILRNEDKLSFSDAPRDYIPGFRFFEPAMDEQITIRDLMCHRTGLPRHDYSWYFFPTDSRDSLIERIAYQQPTAGVREKWQYNNFMFLTQGVIAEKITDKTWEDNIREKFFAPLGMTRSNLSISELKSASNKAFGYETVNDVDIRKTDYYAIRAMAPAGSINSSVAEMSRYVRMWIHGGNFEGIQILPENYVQEAISSQMVISGALPEAEFPNQHFSNYGYGWFLSSYQGHYRVEHGGNIDGFSASTAFFPSDSIGIVVLANQNGSVIPTVIRNIIADRLLGLPEVDWSGKVKEQVDKQKAAAESVTQAASSSKINDTSPSHPLKDYEGTYESAAAGKLRIYSDGDSLFARTSYGKTYLRHFHYDVFELLFEVNGKIDTTANNYRIIFETDQRGEVSEFTINLEANIDRTRFKRTIEGLAMEENQLDMYTGEYVISGMKTKFFVKSGKLKLSVPNQPEYELIPVGNHEFKTKELEGYGVKFIIEEDRATAVDFIQPNGTFQAIRSNN